MRVITFNAAAGNSKFRTGQRAFLELSFYREVIDGLPEAPLVALQEVGPGQARALRRAAAGGRFGLVQIRRPGQGNALLVPARFELLRGGSRYFVGSQLAAILLAGWRAATTDERPEWRQYLELRMWTEARLRDRRAGRDFTVFNTHLSGDRALRLAQARALARRVHRARRHGPVILAGDLNACPADAAAWAQFAPLQDMAPAARDPRRAAVDHVLATGFEAIGARQYTDDALQLPGLTSAELISDHYAKEALLLFNSG